MAYNLELLFAQVQSLYETANALKKTTVLDGDLLDDVEAKLQCLQGVQQRFAAANSALHQQVLTREQTEKAQRMATDFWKICTEVELILRTYVQKIKRHMGEQKPVGACQESVSDTVKELIQEHNESIKVIADSVASAISHGQLGQSKAKLPLLQLPTFSGKYSEWQGFYDSFLSTVHNNKDLSDVDKFTYLRGALTGSAASALKHTPTSSKYYHRALEILLKKFNKPNCIVAEFVDTFYSQQALPQPNAVKLREMYNVFEEVTHGLEAIDHLSHEPFMIHSALKRVDPETRSMWHNEVSGSEIRGWQQFRDFLSDRCDALEMAKTGDSQSSQVNSKNAQPSKQSSKSKAALVTTAQAEQNAKCPFCGQKHKVHQCPKFLSAKPGQRHHMVFDSKLCYNCLRDTHVIQDCPSGGCRTCHQKHNTLLHDYYQKPVNSSSDVTGNNSSNNTEVPSKSEQSQRTSQPNVVVGMTINQTIETQQVLLPTVQILVSDVWGRQLKCRALLDSCSQINCITRSFAQRLELPFKNSGQDIKGLGLATTETSQALTISINSLYEPFTVIAECVVLNHITNDQPSVPVSQKVQIPSNLFLADPVFHKPGKIDILLGAGVFMKAIRTHQISGNPSLMETAFGYIIAGDCPGPAPTTNHSHLATCLCVVRPEDSLHTNMEKFWNIEEVGDGQRLLSPEEQKCENHFKLHTTRNGEGRFIVNLPIHGDLNRLGNSREVAEKRFRCTEQRLQKNNQLYEHYRDFMREYESLGHMRLLPEGYTSPRPAVYLCHHPVIKDSTSTPVRVVFDASAKTSSGESLNSVLMVGGKTQEDIFDILLRYRQHNVVLRADVQKMYRQIEVCDADQNMQRILWRESPKEPLKTYLLKTVTYGTACAPFLATRCLRQLAEDEQQSFPMAAEITMRDFYVDDVLTGTSTVEEAKELQRQLSLMLSQGGFKLKKWTSNSAEVLSQIPEADQERSSSHNLDLEDTVKALGLFHNSTTDQLRYQMSDISSPVSRRGILADTARVYDPLGILAPVILNAKILLQSLWRKNLDWDTELVGEVAQKWQEYQDDIKYAVANIAVPRQVTCSGPSQDTQLYLFCDASEKAYGACIYVRTVDSNNKVHSHLLCAKTKVAPLKQLTLPRLELCAATLGSRLMKRVRDALSIPINGYQAFTDSMIVLHWIRGEAQQWKTFVGNRVATVQNIIPPSRWHHVRSEHNPADLASRGATAETLMSDSHWLHGPHWMRDLNMQFDDPEFQLEDNIDLERRSQVTLVLVSEDFWSFITRFSSFSKLVRCIAIWQRFIRILRQRHAQQEIPRGSLKVQEIQTAKTTLVRYVQQQAFPKEYRELTSGKPLPKKSHLNKLQPFLDKENVMRVGGRLSNANIPYEHKHPILMPRNHHVTQLIALEVHRDTLHGGAQLLLAQIRQEFWPIRGIEVAKKVIQQCVICFRAKPYTLQQIMSQCHSSRVTASFPFYHTGVDFCGPFLIKPLVRSQTRVKVYIALFTCMAIRAVHLEVVTALTTEAFIASLRRFIARRGRPAKILCDNATNFIGASRELKELQRLYDSKEFQSYTQDFSANQGIEFDFIPPRSPHFGGAWESLIKRIKHHLTRTMGNTSYTEEQLSTIVTQIEACINSRPLTPLTTDPGDFEILTPAHFLVGRSLTALPEQPLLDHPENRLKQWTLGQQRLQFFWKRWREEFLHTLQQRSKWTDTQPSLSIGDMVIVKEDNLPPAKWMLGRVITVYPGADGAVRVAAIRTASGVYKRAVTKLCLLPIDKDFQKHQFLPGQDGSARQETADVSREIAPLAVDEKSVSRGHHGKEGKGEGETYQ
ncbi:uncharacterized protein LOC129803485 [Phlebotomus papatasi]|uniref:uncharacterized protein LOC129803485 n=1 Tax=Phlebotomus papatasi TaxID=29031 RepID=UPI0024845238|nr:uncharacterized protein LOC129803485 [Phlebotomus papatasi]XP_055706056.1 uncharacterized protein LOC129803485 [Phlebotomus papatasi]XP_055706057.1 uncharacterized protein LOC129803485 [Phlebotomus papatasi]XP_055706058.1 uncharacterized protein LOC129803485 [Phlebotomus papatasi]